MSIFYDLGFVNRGGRLSSPDSERFRGRTYSELLSEFSIGGNITLTPDADGTAVIDTSSLSGQSNMDDITLSSGVSLINDIFTFNGSGNITFPNSAEFAFGTGNFTFEGFIKADTVLNDKFIIGCRSAIRNLIITTGGYSSPAGTLRVAGASGGTITSGSKLICDGEWHHWAVVRNSGVITIYIDGVSYGTVYDSNNYTVTTGTFYIGMNDYGASNYFTGDMGQIRISNSAVYTSNFIAPTSLAGTASTVFIIPGSALVITQESGQPNWKQYQVTAINLSGTVKINNLTQVVESTSGSTTVFTAQECDTSELSIEIDGTADSLEIDLWIEG